MKLTDNPTLNTIITAGIAESFISIKVMIPINWMRVATALNTISMAAQHDSNKMPTQRNVAHNTHKTINDK